MSELLGEFSRKLDAKGRLSLPADFRKELSDNLRMTLSLDGTCLYIFETEDFNKWVDSLFAVSYTHLCFFPGQGDYGGIAGSFAQSPWIQSNHAEDGSLPERGSGHHEPLPAW